MQNPGPLSLWLICCCPPLNWYKHLSEEFSSASPAKTQGLAKAFPVSKVRVEWSRIYGMRTPHKYLLTGTRVQWVLKPSLVPSHWAGTEGQRALRWKGGAGLLAPHGSCIHSPPTSSKYILPNGLCKGSTAQNISLLKIAELEFLRESFRARQSCLPRAFFPFKGVLIWKAKAYQISTWCWEDSRCAKSRSLSFLLL